MTVDPPGKGLKTRQAAPESKGNRVFRYINIMNDHSSLFTDMCEHTGKEPPWSIMLITRYTQVIPWM